MAAGDPYWNNVVLALHMDGTNGSTTFTDLKGHAMTAYGNAQISTAQSKFGGASALFDGTGDGIVSPANLSEWKFGAGDWCVDMWVRPTSDTSMELFSNRNAAATHPIVLLRRLVGGTLTFAWTNVLGGNALALATIETVALNVWTHVALRRYNGVAAIYIGGVASTYSLATGNVPSYLPDPLESITIGAGNSTATSQVFIGNIDDFRITNGVARYTANFTPPVAAFPNAPAQISGTVKDTTGTLAPRAVRAYRKSDGALAGATVSHSTTGVFSIPALDASAHFALTHDSDADPYWPNVVLATHFDTDSVIDPYASSVVLGLHMEGANAGTTFTDVTGKTMTAAGTAALSTNTARFGNTSGKFDTSTANKVTAAASTDWMFGASFTVEFWIYLTAYNAIGGGIISVGGGVDAWNSTNGHHWMAYSGGSGATFSMCSGTFTQVTLGGAVALNSWAHLALTYDGTTARMFVNGTVANSVATSIGVPSTTPTLSIGELIGLGTTQFMSGYLDDIRITKGVARYTAAFTPPTVPFSSFKDLTGKDLMVSGVPSINTGTKKYGDGSLALSGTLTHLEAPISTDLTFGSADFTIELYAYLASTATAGLIAMGTGNNQLLLYSNTSNLLLYASSTGSSWDVASAAVIKTSFTTAQWYHIVVCRKGGVLMAFLDGVRVLNIAVATASLTPPLGAIFVGSQNATANTLNGYLDDLRITNGIARYLSDFTPPERAFPGAVGAGTANAQIFDDLIPI